MRRVLFLLLVLGLFLAGNAPGGCPAVPVLDNCFLARAQAPTQAQVVLYPADASGFPTISSFMDVFDVMGRFVSGLKAPQITVTEDGQTTQGAQLTEMVVPLQLAVAINPGPPLGVQQKAKTRFQELVDVLGAWIQSLPADTPDDMSLVSINGPIIAHGSARDWLVSLGAFQPNFRATTPNLQSLQIAIDTVSVQPPRVGMKRAVFLITPHMDDANIADQVQTLIQRANANKVRIFVWFADTDLYTASPSAAAFTTLAEETGGAFFAATGVDPYPDPETYFAPLRRLYALQYQSAVKTGGSHSFSVAVQGQAGAVKSADQTFSIDLQPPNPIFVSPPLQIVRSPPPDDPYNEKVLLPAEQHLDIIVEFPDGHKRALVRTTLYVDGQVAAENKAEPFDSFIWNLQGYKESGEHKIAVEAEDAFTITKSSIEIPVTVTVIQAPHGLPAFFGRYRQSIMVGAVVFAGVVLLLILFMGRLRTLFLGARAAQQAHADPLTQSVAAAPQDTAAMQAQTTRKRRVLAPKPAKHPVEAAASLRPMLGDPLGAPGEIFKPAPAAPIPLASKEMTFGTDPAQSSYVLNDPSLAARHARVTQSENGDYFIVDAGTIGGTWVNFEPVGQEAQLLRHGDVIHFGQLVFRFELKEPPPPVQPKVSKVPPEA
jgi:FHA domain-containing protein